MNCKSRHLKNEQVQEYIAKGKFFRSGQPYGLLHKCPSPSLNVILMGIDDVPPEDTDEGEQENTCNLDEPLCKLCQTPCKGNNEKVPQYFEDLLCNLDCFEEYRSRTSNRFIREEIFKIERGICTNCKLKCHQLVKDLKLLSIEKRQEYIRKVAPTIAKRHCTSLCMTRQKAMLGMQTTLYLRIKGEGSPGECKLENMRTLCVACHADVTTAVFRTAFCQEQGKELLKERMDGLINAGISEKHNVLQGCDLESQSTEIDHYLLIDIPGSAY